MAMTSATLQVGAKAPDFTLPTADRKTYTLSRMIEQGPVVLIFIRGTW
jgi:peroxiredoxin